MKIPYMDESVIVGCHPWMKKPHPWMTSTDDPPSIDYIYGYTSIHG